MGEVDDQEEEEEEEQEEGITGCGKLAFFFSKLRLCNNSSAEQIMWAVIYTCVPGYAIT